MPRVPLRKLVEPEGNLISMRTRAGSFYYTTDALGSIILLADSTQAKAATYSYDSWGNATSTGAQAANNPWQYAGGYYEASTNRIKMVARYYNPYRGWFTQADPSGQEANRYAYVGCNPINATDPSGLDTAGWLLSGIIALGSGILFIDSLPADFATAGLATPLTIGSALVFVGSFGLTLKDCAG
jgi:RHS repeat-associated protein